MFRIRRFPLGLLLSALLLTPGARVGATPESEAPADSLILLPERVPTALMVGSALLESGDVRGALPYFRFAHEQNPTDRALGERYVDVALRAGRPREAMKALDNLLEGERETSLLLRKAHLHVLMGQADRVGPLVEEVLEREPDNEEAEDLQVQAWAAEREFDRVIDALGQRLEDDPDDIELHLQLAEILIETGKEDEAERLLRRAHDLDPSDVRPLDILTPLLSPDRREELIPLLERYLERAGPSPVHQARLADLYLMSGEIEKSVSLLIPLVQRAEVEDRAEVVVVELLESLDRADEARALLEDRAELGPPSALRQRLLGDLAAVAGDREAATRHFERALELDPDRGGVYASYLLLLASGDEEESPEEREQRHERMARLAERAVPALEDRSLRQHFVVGAVLNRIGDYERAVELLEEARRIAPEDRRTLYELALGQERLERDEDAAETLKALLELDPEDPEILNFYGYLLAENGWQLERAERAVERALEAEPRNGAYLDSLGWVYYQQGRYQEALDKLVDASNLVGDDPVVLEHLGDCLRALGEIEDARNAYRRALLVGGDEERLQKRLEELDDATETAPR